MLVKSDMDIEIHKNGLFNDLLIYKDTDTAIYFCI